MLENYNASTNTLSLPPKGTHKLRGFIVSVADSQEDLEAVQRGEAQKFNISPILAPNEEVALEHIQKLGKIAISIVPLELLEMQLSLLYELAKKQNIELTRENLFKIENI